MGAGDRLRELDSRVLPRLTGNLLRLERGPARLRLLCAVALLSVVVVLVTALWAQQRGAPEDSSAPGLVPVGVVPGQPVDGYVRSSRDELAALLRPSTGTGVPMYALISFTGYLSPGELVPVVAGVSMAQVYARVPLTGIPSQVQRIPAYRVPEDVLAGMLDAAQRRDLERGEFARLDVALDLGDEGERRLHRAYDTAAQVAGLEAAAYRAGCGCVFAAVVFATATALDVLAARPGVRAVDPAPEVRRLDRVEFRPPLPEQQIGGSGSPDGHSPSPSVTTGAPRQHGGVPPVVSCPPSTRSPISPAVVTSDSPVGSGASSPSLPGALGRSTAVPSALPADPGDAAPAPGRGTSDGAPVR